jgi:hypothetical protein
MGQRLQLQNLLETITDKVYFQPPANVQMEYPCIVYQKDGATSRFAGNIPYRYNRRYQVTVIDRNPDSEITDKVAALPMCVFDRSFVAENLNHDVFSLYV